MTEVLQCTNCNSIIKLSKEQYSILENVYNLMKHLRNTGIKVKFNRLNIFNKTAKCCDNPSYFWR